MYPKLEVIILGAGGHAKVLIEALRLAQPGIALGLLDPDRAWHGRQILDVPVLGDDDLLPSLAAESPELCFVVGVGAIVASPHRRRLFDLAQGLGLRPFTVIHPAAIISPSAQIEAGAQILAGAVVNTEARIGANAIVNTRAVVEHNCQIQAHAHVATGACLAGGVQVDLEAMIGAGATLRQSIHVAAGAVVGAGAVVVRDVLQGETVVGVPAKALVHYRGIRHA